MIERGGDYLVSLVVTFSITQNVGGLVGSALLGSMQTLWARQASAVIADQLNAGDPQVIGRIATGSASLAATIGDPALLSAQGTNLLGQAMSREAAVIAFTDTFRMVGCLALVIALFIFVSTAYSRYQEKTVDRPQ